MGKNEFDIFKGLTFLRYFLVPLVKYSKCPDSFSHSPRVSKMPLFGNYKMDVFFQTSINFVFDSKPINWILDLELISTCHWDFEGDL